MLETGRGASASAEASTHLLDLLPQLRILDILLLQDSPRAGMHAELLACTRRGRAEPHDTQIVQLPACTCGGPTACRCRHFRGLPSPIPPGGQLCAHLRLGNQSVHLLPLGLHLLLQVAHLQVRR